MIRPPFEIAVQEWRRRLEAAGAATHIQWAFHENLCVRYQGRRDHTHHLLYQLEWPAITERDVARVYERLLPEAEVVVFQRLFSEPDFSLCTLAGDTWGSEDEDLHQEWNLHFATRDPYIFYSRVQGHWEWRFRRLMAIGMLSDVDFVVSYRRAMGVPFWRRHAG